MRRNLSALTLSLSVLLAVSATARADVVASCNYDFDVGPQTYDRGSIQVVKLPTGLAMQIVQDDEISYFKKVVASTANGDQARGLIKKDESFRVYVSEAHITPDQIDRVDAYVVPPADHEKVPQARFFSFYDKTGKYIGGFGTFGTEPFSCDWVE